MIRFRFVGGVVALSSMLALGVAQGKDTKDAQGNRAGHSVTKSDSQKNKGMVGKAGARFTTVDTSGNTVSLSNLLKRPTVLIFIEEGCPCCKGGKPYMDRMQNHYRDIANLVGVVYGDADAAKKWKRDNNPQFTVLADPEGKIARAYQAEAGLATRVLDTKGVIRLSYPGYSASMLREVAIFIEKAAKVKPRNMRTYPAPAEMTTGCKLGGH